MYLKIGLGIVTMIALALLGHFIGGLPDKYRAEGAKAERAKIEKEIDLAVERETRSLQMKRIQEALDNELKYQTMRSQYEKELHSTRTAAANAERLLFNKDRICADETSGASKTESGSGFDAGSSSKKLFPEPYATDINELMLEADLNTDKIRALQQIINSSSCFTVVKSKKDGE